MRTRSPGTTKTPSQILPNYNVCPRRYPPKLRAGPGEEVLGAASRPDSPYLTSYPRPATGGMPAHCWITTGRVTMPANNQRGVSTKSPLPSGCPAETGNGPRQPTPTGRTLIQPLPVTLLPCARRSDRAAGRSPLSPVAVMNGRVGGRSITAQIACMTFCWRFGAQKLSSYQCHAKAAIADKSDRSEM